MTFSKRGKLTVAVLTIILLLVGGFGAKSVYDRKQLYSAEGAFEYQLSKLTAFEPQVESYFVEENPDFVHDIEEEKLAELKAEWEGILKEDDFQDYYNSSPEYEEYEELVESLSERLEELVYKTAVQSELNALFSEAAIQDDQVEADLAIKDDLHAEEIAAVQPEEAEEDAWYTAVNGLMTSASDQLKQIETAAEAVAKLFDGDEINSEVSREDYDSAEEEVDKIKNEKAKNELSDRLVPVIAFIDEKEAEEARLLVEAEAEAEAAAVGGTVVWQEDGTYIIVMPEPEESTIYSDPENNNDFSNSNEIPSSGSGGGSSSNSGYSNSGSSNSSSGSGSENNNNNSTEDTSETDSGSDSSDSSSDETDSEEDPEAGEEVPEEEQDSGTEDTSDTESETP